MEKDLPIYEIDIDEYDDETGMFLVSFVASPAIEVAWMAFSQAQDLMKFEVQSEEEMTLTGPVMIPDIQIYRNVGGEREVVFTAEKIKKIRDNFFQRTGNIKMSNKDHDSSVPVNAVVVESWLIRDAKYDTSHAYGYTGDKALPVGTMMATYKVLDRKFWDEEVKTGNVTGFSLEGRFLEREVKMSQESDWEQQLVDEIMNILKS